MAFWEYLSGSQRRLLSGRVRLEQYQAGQPVYGPNDCLGVLLVQEGILRTYLLSENGREITVYRLRAGEVCVLSVSCILDALSLNVQMDAEEDSRVLLIPAEVFAALTRDNIYVENFSYKMAAERFSDVINAVERMLFMSLEERLAAFLLDEAAASGGLEIYKTHEQIAKAIGSAREAVSRALKRMAENGTVQLFRGGLRIMDKPALYRQVGSL